MEVSAKLKHEVLFPGDVLKCYVTIKNTTSGFDARPLSVAWVTLGVYGLLIVDPTWVILPPIIAYNPVVHQSKGVGSYLPKIDESKGRFIFSGPQIVVLCDRTLNPGESNTVLCSCSLPVHLPPSFMGSALRYTYYVALIGQKHITNPIVSTRFPFTIINPEAGIVQKKLDQVSINGFVVDTSDLEANFLPPLLERAKGGEGRRWNPNAGAVHDVSTPIKESTLRSTLEAFLSNSQTVTVNINKGQYHVCKFSMPSSVYKLGDIITGHFDLSKGVLPCFQIVVFLQYTEEINSSVLHPHRKNMQKMVHEVDSFAQATMNTITTSFIFELPLDGYPQLTTEFVDVQWSLGFEFITSKLQHDRKGELYVDYQSTDVERFDWNLPIKVLVPFYPNEVDTRCRKVQDPKSILRID